MNNKDNQSISAALAAATCSLLGTALPQPVQAEDDPVWEFDTALLYYGESDDRVQDISVAAIARRMFPDDRYLSLGLTVDGLTGATPNGAITQGVPQTFTRPSGNAAYTVAAGKLPLDDTFHDTRVAVTAGWQQPLGETSLINVGMSASKEYDYMHLGVNGQFAKDFNKRNTTVSAGFAYAKDSIEPVGGAPTGMTQMLDVGDLSNRMGDQDKDVLDLLVGVTQVMSRNLIMQFNYSYSQADGYLTDPYKVLSLVDGTTGDTLPNIAGPNGGPSGVFLFESRPDERTKQSFYVAAKYYMNGKVLDASYRYMTDDWEIESSTFDVRYRWPFGERSYLEPHVRFYSQTNAEFYRVSLSDAEPLPAFASADFRLGDFDSYTVGLKYGWKTRNDHDMNIRVEWYNQSGTVPAGQIIGNEANFDNFPDLNALIVQFGYSFGG